MAKIDRSDVSSRDIVWFTLDEMNAMIVSNDYNAELLLQHSMHLLNSETSQQMSTSKSCEQLPPLVGPVQAHCFDGSIIEKKVNEYKEAK